MSEDIAEIIQEFSASHIAAEPNARLMCSHPSQQTIDECGARMRRVSAADAAVYALAWRGDLPSQLQCFLDAESDKGCSSCWISSRRDKQHPECREKIARWFAARDALIKFDSTPQPTTPG